MSTPFDPRALEDLARRLSEAMPPQVQALRNDFEANFKGVLQAGLAKLDLVTRLASKAIQKSQFKTLAEKYRARNEAGGRGSRVYRVWPPPTPSAATRHSRLPARRRSSPTTAPRHPAVASDPLRQHSARPGPGLSCAVVPPRPLAARGTTAGPQR